MKDDLDYRCILDRAIFGIKSLNGPKDCKNVREREKHQVRFFYKHTCLKNFTSVFLNAQNSDNNNEVPILGELVTSIKK